MPPQERDREGQLQLLISWFWGFGDRDWIRLVFALEFAKFGVPHCGLSYD